MARLRTAALLAPVLASAVALPALAGGGTVPAPTVTVVTSAQGQQLPVSPFQASWTVKQPGRAASLDVHGETVSHTATTIHASWTSAWRRVSPNRSGLSIDLSQGFTYLARGDKNNSGSLTIQARKPGGRWQSWGSLGMSSKTVPLVSGADGVGIRFITLQSATYQWRIRVSLRYDDTSDESAQMDVRI